MSDVVLVTIYCSDKKFHGAEGLVTNVVSIEKGTETTFIDEIQQGRNLDKADACPIHNYEFLLAEVGDGWDKQDKAMKRFTEDLPQ